MTDYSIHQHMHVLACWAAGRAAMRGAVRFRGEDAHNWLEAIGFTGQLTLDRLHSPSSFDLAHRKWRCELITTSGRKMKDGQAAKLINVYCKVRYIDETNSDDPKVAALHPPIDAILPEGLAACKNMSPEKIKYWRKMGRKAWSNFTSEEYEDVIAEIRDYLNGRPL